jgi:hypothetical protein
LMMFFLVHVILRSISCGVVTLSGAPLDSARVTTI